MNANELADELNKILEDKSALFGWEIKCIKNAEAMLRQQQAEIEALKKEAALQRLSDFTQEAENEPVAWISKFSIQYLQEGYDTKAYPKKDEYVVIPLYTHPAKTIKNLKDGELPVLTVTVLDCNGKLIRSVVSFKETRIICDSLVDELKKANEK